MSRVSLLNIYIYILYSVSIYLSVCLFLCLSVCLPVSLYAVNVLYVYMHGSVCIGGVCVCICCLLCTQSGACTGDSISRFVPVQRQHVFFGRMKRKTKYKSQLIRFSCWHARWSMVWPARFCVQLEEMNPKPNGQTDQMKHWWKTWDINIFVFAACWCFPVRGMDP